MTLEASTPNWKGFFTELSHCPAQHEAFHRLRSMPVGTKFKLKYLLSDNLRPNARGGEKNAAKAIIRKAMKLNLIRRCEGVTGLIPYYEKVR